MNPADPHPALDALLAFTQGTLVGAERKSVESHLSRCEQCRGHLSSQKRSEAADLRVKPDPVSRGQEATVDLSAEQIWNAVEREILELERAGRAVDLESFVKRFPHLRERLLARIAATSGPSNRTDSYDSDSRGSSANATRPQRALEGGSTLESSKSSRPDLRAKGTELKPGNSLGKYLLLDVLGRGGMGVVFKARNQETGDVVALKTIARFVGADDELVKRFRREAKTSARLTHPNIVCAVEAADVDGTPYLALELVPGTDLAKLVRAGGPLPLSVALDYVRQAANGLGYAHEQGVVHRDVKPSNMLVHSETGEVKLLDLGLARVEAVLDEFTRASELTSTGAVFGTVDFMAPEQARDAKRADQRADIYSLGCTLHFLLTGKMVYPGDTMLQKIRLHRESPIPNLKEACPEIPLILNSAFQRMVAKEPDDRFADMQEVIAALGRVGDVLEHGAADDTPETVSFYHVPRTRSIQIASSHRRRITQRFAALGVGIVLLLGAIGLLWNTSKKTPDNTTALTTEVNDAGSTNSGGDEWVSSEAVKPPYVWEWPKNYPQPAVAPFDSSRAKASQAAWADKLKTATPITNSLKMEFVLIPPGEYSRGSAGDVFGYTQPGGYGAEVEHYRPITPVRLTFPVMLGKHEVTHEQFKVFVDETGYVTEAETLGKAQDIGTNGSWTDTAGASWKSVGNRAFDPQEPVTFVTWRDAQAFCGWLSRKEGVTYRLPTEAEWEFAARAGSTMRFGEVDRAVDLVAYAWADEGTHQAVEKRRSAPHPIGLKQPNAFGIHDMLGNVWEICHDSYDAGYYSRAPLTNPSNLGGPYCAVRGGSFLESYATANPAIRTTLSQQPYAHAGFRVVRELPIPPELNPLGEPILVKDGEPMSPRATVQSPPELSGVRSWSIELATSPTPVQSLVVSPTSKQIAVAGNGESIIRIYDEKLALKKLLMGKAGDSGYGAASGLAWSPDGQLLASTDWGDFRGHGLRIWDVETGSMILHREGLASWTPTIAWSPDGKHLLVSGQETYVVNIVTGIR